MRFYGSFTSVTRNVKTIHVDFRNYRFTAIFTSLYAYRASVNEWGKDLWNRIITAFTPISTCFAPDQGPANVNVRAMDVGRYLNHPTNEDVIIARETAACRAINFRVTYLLPRTSNRESATLAGRTRYKRWPYPDLLRRRVVTVLYSDTTSPFYIFSFSPRPLYFQSRSGVVPQFRGSTIYSSWRYSE